MASDKIERYDPNWEESSQSMELQPYGDYVEFDDHITWVNTLQGRIDHLEEIVTQISDLVQGE